MEVVKPAALLQEMSSLRRLPGLPRDRVEKAAIHGVEWIRVRSVSSSEPVFSKVLSVDTRKRMGEMVHPWGTLSL